MNLSQAAGKLLLSEIMEARNEAFDIQDGQMTEWWAIMQQIIDLKKAIREWRVEAAQIDAHNKLLSRQEEKAAPIQVKANIKPVVDDMENYLSEMR